MKQVASIITLLLFIVLAAGSEDTESNLSEEDQVCRSDFSHCISQTQLMEHYSGMVNARINCKVVAEQLAQYGEPDFPWSPFQTYLRDEKSYKTGKITLVETDAKFMNGFGAMRRSRVVCVYDLRTNTVLDVSVS